MNRVQIRSDSTHVHPKTGKEISIQNSIFVDSRTELEAAIIKRNEKHFSQGQAKRVAIAAGACARRAAIPWPKAPRVGRNGAGN